MIGRPLSPQAQSILKTLLYADIFQYPLTVDEIYHRLITSTQIQSADHVSQIIKKNLTHHIGYANGYYFLKNHPDHLPIRQSRQKHYRPKLKHAQKIANILKTIPTIELLAITGSLSVQNADPQDDIDFMIITSPGTLWTTRLHAVALLELLRARRRPQDAQVSNKICLNLFLDKKSIQVPKSRQNLYTAYEVIQAQPLWTRNRTYHHFLTQNEWASNYLPHAWESQVRLKPAEPSNHTQKAFLPLARSIEPLTRKLQLHYMQPRHTTEKVTPTQAFFHPQDHRPHIMDQYHQRLSMYNLNP